MSESKSGSSDGGIGLLGALFLVLLTLKLLGKITLSWLWVTAPLWGGIALALTILLGFAVFAGCAVIFAAILDAVSTSRRRKQ